MKYLKSIEKFVEYDNFAHRSEVIRSYFSYEKIKYSPKMLFSSTCCYYQKNDKGIYQKKLFPFKLFIPDFIVENFSLQSRQRKKTIIDFLKIFINELVVLDYLIEENRDIYLYTFSFSQKIEEGFRFNNRKNIINFFSQFFEEEVEISENYPRKHINNKIFKLGCSQIFSKNINKSCVIGHDFYSFLNRVSVDIIVNKYELDNLKKILKILNLNSQALLFADAKNLYGKNIKYKYKFIIEGNKCISAFSIPNHVFHI